MEHSEVFVLVCVMSLFYFQAHAKNSGGCILYLDNRSMQVRSASEAPWTYLEERAHDIPYWITTKFINRNYAQKHGYQFIASNGTEYGDGRATAWIKVKFMKDCLISRCKWAFFLDSDAYFRMEDQTLSVEDWLKKLTQKDYYKELVLKDVNLANQTWFPEDPTRLVDFSVDSDLIGLFPRNGDNKEGWCGKDPNIFFPDPPHPCGQFLNTGVMLMKNTTKTLEFLDDWYNEWDQKWFTKHPWEQKRHSIIVSKYKKNIIVVPYMDATGPMGRQIRHVWSAYGAEGRHKTTKDALLGLIATMDIQPQNNVGSFC